jgi:uncharacterized protein (DUF2384 family)
MNSREKLLKYGIQVFNGELDKFSNWLLKPNFSLGGKIPNELIETEEGLREVKHCLNRIEFGNFS